jgi:cytochrome c biogenesis protein CcdA
MGALRGPAGLIIGCRHVLPEYALFLGLACWFSGWGFEVIWDGSFRHLSRSTPRTMLSWLVIAFGWVTSMVARTVPETDAGSVRHRASHP